MATGDRSIGPGTTSASSLLVLSHLAIILPALAFCGLLLWRYVDREQSRLEIAAHSRVEAITGLIDKRLTAVMAVAETLAASAPVAAESPEAFLQQAGRVLKSYGDRIDLRDRTGLLLASTERDTPRALEPDALAAAASAARQRRPIVSDLLAGTGQGQRQARIVAPVLNMAGPVDRFVEITFPVDHFHRILLESALPDGWFAGVVDSQHRFVARSRLNNDVIGQLAPEGFRSQVGTSRQGAILLRNPEGVEVLNVYRRLTQADWITSIGVSTQLLRAPLRRSLLTFAGIGLLLVTFMALSSYYFSRRFRRAGQRLTDLAEQVGRNQVVEPVSTRLREVDTVARVLSRLSHDLALRGAERDASEARYRQAVEVGRLGSWETDFAAGKRYWSPEAQAIFGLSLADGIGTIDGPDDEWRNAFHEDDRASADVIRDRLKDEDELDLEYRIRRPDGHVAYLHGHARVLERESSGKVLRLINVVADVTSRRTAEQSLGASEARYQLLFENIEAGFCIVEVSAAGSGEQIDYRVVEANPAFYRQTGLPADILGKWLRKAAPDLEEHWFETYGRVARTGRAERFEQYAVALQRWYDVYAFQVPDKGSDRVAILFTDITERRNAEDELRRLNLRLEERVDSALAERRLLADVLENTAIFIQVVDLEWRWLAINKAAAQEFERIFGVRPKVGDDMRRLLEGMPEHKAAVEAVWARALAGEAFSETAEFGDPSLTRRAYEMRFYPLKDAQGALIGAYQFVTDVTERLAAERKLNEMQKMEMIGQFTGGVAHDFNNLLAAILSNLELVRKRALDERSARLLDGAIKGAERGASLTRRLLAFARRQDLKNEAVDLHQLISGMQDLIDRSRGEHIEVISQIPADLPAVRVDPHQLELAILNLVINARDAMPEGGRITLGASVENVGNGDSHGLNPGPYVRLKLEDTGHGMDTETLKRATEPFFTTKGIGKGTGLGLSMVQGLAAQSGGVIRIDSEVGRGTSIELWLPQATDPVPAPAIGPTEAAVEPARHRTRTVLVVDDDVLVSMGTVAMLEDLGHVAIEAGGGRQALKALAQNPQIELVITDQAMPGMTGVELSQQIAKEYPGMPVILATGYADLPGGVVADLPRLAKPFGQGDLAQALARVFEKRA